MSDYSDYLGYWSARAGNRTNQLLREQNELLRQTRESMEALRRQQLTPEQRKAEDDARARHERQVALEEAARRKTEADAAKNWGKWFVRTLAIFFVLRIVRSMALAQPFSGR